MPSDLRRVRAYRQAHAAGLVILLLLLLILPLQAGRAQSAIAILKDLVLVDYPDKLTFQVKAQSAADIQSITLIYSTNVHTCQPAAAHQEPDFEAGSTVEAEWELDFSVAGIYPPGTLLTWQWQITDSAGNTLLTEAQSYRIIDNRNTWNTLSEGPITIQWYRGTAAFGQALMDISSQALERLAEEAGIVPPEQVWISIYPSAEDIQEVDVHSSEWAGAIAYPDYQSIIAGIGPYELEWAAEVLPHELAHLTTDLMIFNCRGGRMPTWLSEGLAVSAEGNLEDRYYDLVLSALEADDLPPLRTIARGFSPYPDEAIRSYGHGGMIVKYMLDQYGPTSMADLLSAIQTGMTPDEALLETYALDTDGLDAAWRVSLGFQPQPTLSALEITATQIPTMALWTAVIQSSATPSPSASLTPEPTRTPEPAPPQPDTAPSPEPTPTPEAASPGLSSILLWVGIPLGLVLLGGIIFFVSRRTRRKT